jgi:hypothetical protein
MKKFFKLAQADPAGAALPPPPPPPPAAMGAPPPMPMPPLGGADPMAGLGSTPPPPAPAGTDRQEIIGPIKTITQIFYDMDVAKFIQNNLASDSKDLAELIWIDYGGKENGDVDPAHVGTRVEDDAKKTPEEAGKDRKSTEDSKWQRLEKGKTIGDIISYEDLGKMTEGLIYGVMQKANVAGAAPPGGAPPGGGLMASSKARIIIAKILEKQGDYYLSDTIIKEFFKNLSSN